MNILICDDIQRETQRLAKLLEAEGCTPRVCGSGTEALALIEGGAPVDVCVLDILMPGMNGIELAAKLRQNGWRGQIVFLSTERNFAPESYRVGAFDYLLKPPTPEKVRDMLKRLTDAEKNADKKAIALKTAGAVRSVYYHDISYVEARLHHVVFRLVDGSEISVYAAFADTIQELLGDSRFARCHRSYVVNLDEVLSITGFELVTRGEARIPISKRYVGIKTRYFEHVLTGASR